MSTLTSKERALLKALHDIALYQGHYASDKNPTVRGLKKIAVDAIDAFHEPPPAHETNELLSIAQKVEPGELEQLRRIDQAARKFVEKAESRGEWKSYPEWGELNTAIFDGSPTQKACEGRS